VAHKEKFDDIRKAKYLDLLRAGCNKHGAASMVGVSPQTVANHRKKYPDFENDETGADMEACARVESFMYTAAKGGNVSAQIFFLKNRLRRRWKDSHDLEATLHNVTVNVAGAGLAMEVNEDG